MVFRADIVAFVPFHACDAREVSGGRARLPQQARVSQRGDFHFKIQAADEQTKRQRLPRLTHASHGLRSPARVRARGGMFYSVDLLSPKGALGQIWVRRARTTPSRPRRARVSPSSFVLVLRPNASDESPAPRVRRSWRTSRAAWLA